MSISVHVRILYYQTVFLSEYRGVGQKDDSRNEGGANICMYLVLQCSF